MDTKGNLEMQSTELEVKCLTVSVKGMCSVLVQKALGGPERTAEKCDCLFLVPVVAFCLKADEELRGFSCLILFH